MFYRDRIIYRSHHARIPLFFSLVITILLQTTAVFSAESTVTIQSNPYTLQSDEEGNTRISMEDFGIFSQEGYPRLPSKIFYIALPRKAQLRDVQITPVPFESFTERYDLASTKPLLPTGDIEIPSILSQYAEKRERIYNTDAFFPESAAEYMGVNHWRDYALVKVRFTPFQYNPVRRELRFTGELHVRVDYLESEDSPPQEGGCFVLRDGLDGWIDEKTNALQKQSNSSGQLSTDQISLFIISSETLEDIIKPFIYWKSFLGHTVEFVSTEEIYAQMTGDDKAEQIRNFLKEKPGLEHVLLIGDRDIVPMKVLYPDPCKHYGPGAVPSDLYYAELTGDWDTDGDGYPGEFGQDNMDLVPEISVGRIPWSDSTVVRNILKKTIEYEKNAGTWKEQALLMGAINNYMYEYNNYGYYARTDGATLMELLKQNIFQSEWTHSLYEKEGINPSRYPADMPLNRDNIFSSWTSGSYGCITWWSHGAFNKVTRKWWREDNGNQVPESHELVTEPLIHKYDYPVNESYPPIIFANSCDNGWPEKESLGRELIKNGSAGIVSASRVSWYILGWSDLDDGGDASMTYFFWDEYINIEKQKTLGEAVNFSKLQYISHFNGAWQHLHNTYTYNCYGDPTLQLRNPEPIYGGLSGIVSSGDDGEIPVSGVTVSFIDSSHTTATDANGKFQFLCVPGGSYDLIISGDEIQPDTTTVEIINGEICFTNIQLPSDCTGCETTSESILPTDFVYQNYPNPFNSGTSIHFNLSGAGRVRITIYNASGQIVNRLVDNHMPTGMHSVLWKSEDSYGNTVPSGMYFYEVITPRMRNVKKMMFLK